MEIANEKSKNEKAHKTNSTIRTLLALFVFGVELKLNYKKGSGPSSESPNILNNRTKSTSFVLAN